MIRGQRLDGEALVLQLEYIQWQVGYIRSDQHVEAHNYPSLTFVDSWGIRDVSSAEDRLSTNSEWCGELPAQDAECGWFDGATHVVAGYAGGEHQRRLRCSFVTLLRGRVAVGRQRLDPADDAGLVGGETPSKRPPMITTRRSNLDG